MESIKFVTEDGRIRVKNCEQCGREYPAPLREEDEKLYWEHRPEFVGLCPVCVAQALTKEGKNERETRKKDVDV